MLKCAKWLLACWPVLCSAQVWEGAAGRFVESGTLSVEEAAALEDYLASSGLPVSIEEAAAVPGLSPEGAQRLMADPIWSRWVQSGQDLPARSRLRLTWDLRRSLGLLPADSLAGGPLGWGVRAQRSGHWALRCDRGPGEAGIDHVAGFVVAPTLRGVRTIWGDHVIRWGQGLVGWSSSAYDGMRSATSAQRMTQDVRPVLAGDALPVRRGLAASSPVSGGRAVVSLDVGGREVRLEDGVPVTWYGDGQHRTPAERNRTQIRPVRTAMMWHRTGADRGGGLACEWGNVAGLPSAAIVGGHSYRNFAASRWVGEVAWSKGGLSWVLGSIWTWSPELDAFMRWERYAPHHPGSGWGDVRPAGGAMWTWGWERRGKRMNQFARWEWDGLDLKSEVQTQFELRRKERLTIRWQRTDELRCLVEYRRDQHQWGLRCWGQIIQHHGTAGGLHWTWQPAPDLPTWRLGWSRSDLAPGALVYRLEPNAQTWQTTTLSGRGQRWWMQVAWKWSRHWKCTGSASFLHREDRWSLEDSGPWEWKGAGRGEVRLRLSYAM